MPIKPMISDKSRTVNFEYLKSTTRKFQSYHISEVERHNLISIGVNAYLLYEHYLMQASMSSDKLLDKQAAAKYFGLSTSQIDRAHRILTKNGYYARTSYRRGDGLKGTHYYLGLRAVENYHSQLGGDL
jgi:hypothetical protein